MFEGADGVGKSTQAEMAVRALREQDVDAISLYEPTRESQWGIRLRQLMLEGRGDPEEEFELFKKDRKFDVDKYIMPSLQAGRVVIVDRYYISSMAYQGALGVSGLTPERIRRENEEFAPEPDLLLYFDLPAAVAQQRITCNRGKSLNTFEQTQYQQRVREVFEKNILPVFKNVQIIDASLSISDVHTTVMQKILSLTGKK